MPNFSRTCATVGLVGWSVIGAITAHATNRTTTDWTAYLAPMQDSCALPDTSETGKFVIPAHYQSSVVSHKMDGSEYYGTQTIVLKNAVAFGSPLKKIYFSKIEAGYDLVVSFGNSNFMKSLPTFSYHDDNVALVAGGKASTRKMNGSIYHTTPTGYLYEVEDDPYETKLTFDSKAKTIRCHVVND